MDLPRMGNFGVNCGYKEGIPAVIVPNFKS